jgi:hypothetical protein
MSTDPLRRVKLGGDPLVEQALGPYTMASYVRGYNDGFFTAIHNSPYLAGSPETRGYKTGFEIGLVEGGREEPIKTHVVNDEVVRADPVQTLDPTKDFKAPGSAHEDVRMTAFAEGEFDVKEDPHDAAQGLDRRQNEFEYWMNWVREEFDYPEVWTERLAESAYEGYVAGVQEAMNPEAPLEE